MKNRLFIVVIVFGVSLAFATAMYLSRDYQGCCRTSEGPSGLQVNLESSGEPKAQFPNEAHEWRMFAWQDENGNIPGSALVDALTQRNEFLNQNLDRDGFGDLAISHLPWIQRGPQNAGGRTRSILVHPTDPNILWAGSLGGGVWKSEDAGASWMPMNGELQNYAVCSMAMDPLDPAILYAGTGEHAFNLFGPPGGGIFKSEDAGITWKPLLDTIPSAGNPGWLHVNRISISPTDRRVILASTSDNIMRSVNGGENWVDVADGQSNDVSFHPTDGERAIAHLVPGNHNTALYSNSGGASWSTPTRNGAPFHVAGSTSRIELAYHRDNPQIVYALNPTNQNPAFAEISYSTDGGQTYVKRTPVIADPTATPVPIAPTMYHSTLWVSPNDPNLVVAGGIHLFRSTDGGQNFVRISSESFLSQGDQPHVDQHCVVAGQDYSAANKRVYVCNDGGVYSAADITATSQPDEPGGWERKTSGYVTSQYYGAAGGASGLIYGGTQDNGTIYSTTSERNGTSTFGGDGGFNAVDPDETFCYGEHVHMQIHRSNGCRQYGTEIYGGMIGEAGTLTHANFVAPFILDPNDSNRMLAGGRSLWRTDNVKASGQPMWTVSKPPGTHNITAIAIAPGNPNIVWVAHNNSTVYKTANALDVNPNWIAVDDNGPTNNTFLRWITRILIDGNNPDIVYVTQGGFEDGNLRKTINGGSTWQDITGPGLPDVPIRGLTRHPTDPSTLYIGTEIGVYVSENGGILWQPDMEGPVNIAVDEVSFMRNSTILLAATHGRGVWTADVSRPPSPNRPFFDFDGDGRSDVSVFRPEDSNWYLRRSSLGFTNQQFGISTDKIVAADYDGDGKADLCVFRPEEESWYRLNSSNEEFVQTKWGQPGDIAVPADYDGDGKADEAVFRPQGLLGYWHLNRSSLGPIILQWGLASDKPAPEDYDGDGWTDLGVFRYNQGVWYVFTTAPRPIELTYYWGLAEDTPVAADYDGDGEADVAVFRPSTGYWHLLQSSNGISHVQWGTSGDIPVPADYDGDGWTDIAVFRPSDGRWYLRQSTNGGFAVHFGAEGDVPIPKK